MDLPTSASSSPTDHDLSLPARCSANGMAADDKVNAPPGSSKYEYDYVSDTPCPACHRLSSSILHATCPPSNLNTSRTTRRGVRRECDVCSGRRPAPFGGTSTDRWICACTMWEKANGKVADDEMVELREVEIGQVEMDEMLAVKLDGEAGK